MTQEPWRQPADQRGSFTRVSGADRKGSGAYPIRASSKKEMQGSARVLPQAAQQQPQPQSEATGLNSTALSLSSRRGAPLGSLKAYYRKLRTFKGTVQALINLRRTPLLQLSCVKTAAQPVEPPAEEQRRKRSAVLEIPRISSADSSTVRSQVHKLAADGHIVAVVDPTEAAQEVTYREQGNLDLYTEDNLAKRVSLQQHPHMVALTQRLWNCALQYGEKKLRYTDYETYMLCLHRLILPEFDVAASKVLIMDDWKRDSGEKDYLDYAFFHLSMFELVDLWTDTIDPEDYVALLFCITHCLTYTCNESHALKALDDIRLVDILAESKEINLDGIDQDLQREMTSNSFAYYREQVRVAAEANEAMERGMNSSEQQSAQNQQVNRETSAQSSTLEHQQVKNQGAKRGSNGHNMIADPRHPHDQETGNRTASRSRSRERKRSSKSEHPVVNITAADMDLPMHPQGRNLSGSGSHGHATPKRKFSHQSNGHNLVAGSSGTTVSDGNVTRRSSPPRQKDLHENTLVSPRWDIGLQRPISPDIFSRGGGVILNVGMMDSLSVSKPIADLFTSVPASTLSSAAFPRRRPRSSSNSSQHRRDQIQAIADKVENTREATLSTQQIEGPGSALRVNLQDSALPGNLSIPIASTPREPFMIRAAAVTEAAVNMATPVAPMNKRQTFAAQYQLQFHPSQSSSIGGDGVTGSSTLRPRDSTLASNVFMDNSRLTAPLITIVSTKSPIPRDKTPRNNKVQLQFPETQEPSILQPRTARLSNASVTSTQTSHAQATQAAVAFISTQQILFDPSTSPRQTIAVTSTTEPLSMTNAHQPPHSGKLQQRQRDESGSTNSAGSSTTGSTIPLTISGRMATHGGPEISNTVHHEPNPISDSISRLLDSPLGSSVLASETVMTATQPLDDLKALLSPRYIVTNPVGSSHSLNSSTTPRQSMVRPQASTRGFNSPRIRKQPSRLVTGPAASHLHPTQPNRQQRASELQSLAIAPGKMAL